MKPDSEFLDQIKHSVDIVHVIQGYVRLKKSGSNYLGLCPFHSEKTPSFHVKQNPPYYYCFGCQARGDVINFIQVIERVTFPEALRLLADKYGIQIPRQELSGQYDEAAKERKLLLKIHEKATQFFRAQLSSSQEGRKASSYLIDRGLQEGTLEKFLIGYSVNSTNALSRSLGQHFTRKDLLDSGLIQKSDSDGSIYDRFRRRVIFPIRNESGSVIAFGGRILGDGQPKYLNSPETPLYSKSRTLYAIDQARESIRRKGFAILVEGYMDCITLHQAGIQNVVASCGTSLTEQQAKMLSRYTERIVVNFDPDTAGAAAAVRSLSVFVESGFQIRVLTLPAGDDPDSFVKAMGAEKYLKLLDRAPKYVDYLIARARDDHDVRTVEGRIAAVNQVLPFISMISNRLERVEQAKYLAENFGVEESIIREELKKAVISKRGKLEIRSTDLGTKLSPSEKNLLKVMVGNGIAAEKIIRELSVNEDYQGLQSEGIFREAIALFKDEGRIDLNRLQERLRDERDRQILNQAIFNELDTDQSLGCLEGIRLQRMRQQIDELQKKIQQAELSQDFDLLAKLHTEKLALKRQMAG
jgi:DNA primase